MTKKKKKEVEKEKENEKNENDEKNNNEERSKSEQARKKKKEKARNKGAEVPYPVVPSKKVKDRHLERFLDIFRKLEITMTFGEAFQQMSLYSKFLKDMLTRKHKNNVNENMVEDDSIISP